MNKYEIAKELTIIAMQNEYIIKDTSKALNDKTVDKNVLIAEQVAIFYNKLVEKLDVKEE